MIYNVLYIVQDFFIMKKQPSKKSSSHTSAFHTLYNVLASLNLSIEMVLREMAGPVTPGQKKYLRNALSESKKVERLLKKIREKI
jgi:hypothetical protein